MDSTALFQNNKIGGLTAVLMAGVLIWSAPVIADDAATPGANTTTEDPLEDVNRVTSDFNRAVRGAVVDPVVDSYQAVTPAPIQQTISNIFSNLSEPVTAISSLLQGDTENAGNATSRFLINTTIGLGGAGDPATDMGIDQRREDLGQALAAHGVGSGPHFVLPILGPTNLRDVTGDLLTGLATPLPLVVHAAEGGVQYSNNQDDINAISTGAIDPYVAEREAYEQHRAFLIKNGMTEDTADFPNFAEPEQNVANTPK